MIFIYVPLDHNAYTDPIQDLKIIMYVNNHEPLLHNFFCIFKKLSTKT